MRISIFGLGYVGAVSLACLARDGHTVIGVDIDQAKLDLISAGKSPVVEEGMVELMATVASSGRIAVTKEVERAVIGSDLSLICVGTPSNSNGSQDQSAILRIARDLGKALRDKQASHTIVFRSTLIPGTVEDVLRPIVEAASGKKEGRDFYLCFQPEFLREGSSIRDYDRPPFTILGANSDVPGQLLKQLFGHLPCDFHTTSIRAAEMVKYCCNNFHALKITFANEIARVCESLSVDAFEVMDLVCRDTQLNISRAYLRPGFAFGGSCLPKDLRAMTYLSKMQSVEVPMLSSILDSNRVHLERAIQKILDTGRRRIGLVGLSFKPGTDDLRESPLVRLAEHCIGKGLNLVVYDPDVHLSRLLGANSRFIEATIPHIGSLIRSDLQEVIAHAEVLVVGHADQKTAETLAKHVREDQILLDLVRLPNREAVRAQYHGLCW